MNPGPSMKSVAQAAGVSVSSVSNAYNKPEQLSAEVRARILAVAREQGYAGPDAAARSLRSRRAGAIGLVLTNHLSYAFNDPYTVGLVAGVAEIAERSRSGLLLIPLADPRSEDPEAVEQSVDTVRQAVVDGIVDYCMGRDHPAREVIADRGLPLVTNSPVSDAMGRVLIDEFAACVAVGEHIARLGHRRVGIVANSGGPAGIATERDIADDDGLVNLAVTRRDGHLKGLGPDVDVTVIAGGHNAVESGRAAAELLLDRQDRPTAIIAHSDVVALGVLEAVRQRGLVPGRDVSVAGFDDIPAAAPAGLTTVRQPIRDRGRVMARMLLDPTYTERRVILPTELIVRSSTGPAPRD